MRYAIGLDIGVTSVGYAIMELSEQDTPQRIERLGVRIFDAAEQPKTGDSLAAPRRDARGQRRRLRRRKHRLERIYGLIVSSGMLDKEELVHLFEGRLEDIYALRVRAIDEKLTETELARVMIHIAQRRGFKSNRRSANGKEDGLLLSFVSKNALLMKEKGYRTVGELFFRDENFAECKRNKRENYANTVAREAVAEEIKAIFAAQRGFGMPFATEEIEERYLSIVLSQRSFADGPASGPYSGNQVDKMIGDSAFGEGKRCAKATYTFQIFNLWQHINHMRIQSAGGERALTDAERRIVFDYAHQTADLDFAKLRKVLKLGDGERFKGVSYADGKTLAACEKNRKLNDLKVYHELRREVKKYSDTAFDTLTPDQLDEIGEAISKNLSEESITARLKDSGLSDAVLEGVLAMPNVEKYGHLSLAVLKSIIPFLEAGETYDKACALAGYDFQGEREDPKRYLPALPVDNNEITSPVVRRAVSQTIKVINAIIRSMGEESPVYVNIELARELSRSFEDRNEMKKAMEDNAYRNERAVAQLKELGLASPKGFDIVKFKLWQEQDGFCPYSGKHIDIARMLTEPGYVDVDHIVPYSISFDDSMVNKVLVLSEENRQKGNQLPLQYLTGKRRDDFIIWVRNARIKGIKKRNLLLERVDAEGWKQRSLQDTQFISRFMYNYIRENLMFAPSNVGKKRKVYAVNGAITAYVRKQWGIKKDRDAGDLHHAADAAVVACVTQAMENQLSDFNYYHETKDIQGWVDKHTGEIMEFPRPWRYFSKELQIRLMDDEAQMRAKLLDFNFPTYSDVDISTVHAVFVSRKANHKATGAAHKETVRAERTVEGQKRIVSKVELSKLKLDKEGEIEGYYDKDSDRLLYEALKARLVAFGNDGKKAFAEPMYKPRSDGSQGPLVKKVKICEKASLTVSVHQGTAVADNDSMVRCDVFYVEGDGYYFVPVYVADTVKAELPNLACVKGGKPWKEMKEENFCFSLYPKDLIRVKSKRGVPLSRVSKKGFLPDSKEVDCEQGVFLYYTGLDIARAAIEGITHDNTYKCRTIGKTVQKIEKYERDVLGNRRLIEGEKRKGFGKRR
ncbi:MAG: type II CRISPR RNA-guided endonuclease Cas9 [Clostridia bacterium]|nr:type II CRISPR RNA-guided endonuclease Cas9 [Clostridia bacterium]